MDPLTTMAVHESPYGYASNSPVLKSDPMGLLATADFWRMVQKGLNSEYGGAWSESDGYHEFGSSKEAYSAVYGQVERSNVAMANSGLLPSSSAVNETSKYTASPVHNNFFWRKKGGKYKYIGPGNQSAETLFSRFEPVQQTGVTVTITDNITGFTTVRGYPTNVVDENGGKILYTVPIYQITVSTGNYSATFSGIRFGVMTRGGEPKLKGVNSGSYRGTWGVMGHGLGWSLHVDGASNGGIWMHQGPRDINGSRWGAEGCIEITGKGGWDDFKSLMSNIAPQGTPINIVFRSAEIPTLEDSGKRF